MRYPHKAERVTHHKVVAPTKLDMMSYSNNNGGIPVGFRFHPTDEELVGCYLHDRVTTPPPQDGPDVRIIRELDLYRYEPWDLAEVCKIPGDHSVNQNNWYFFSHKDKKYPTGNRANRATKVGFWKATGRDKPIQARAAVGMRKTLVFYRGRAPHGQKTDWIMHEFRLGVDAPSTATANANAPCTSSQRRIAQAGYVDPHEGAGAWVVCRVFRKTKNVKCRGDADTPSTSLEEDHQMALVPELTDSTDKFSSDEGEHVDFYPQAESTSHVAQRLLISNNNSLLQADHACKQELLSVADYAHTDGAMVLAAPQAAGSMTFGRSSCIATNTFQMLDSSGDFQTFSGGGGAGLQGSNSYLLAMLDDHVVGRGDMTMIRGVSSSSAYRPSNMVLNHEGLEDLSRFGANPAGSLMLLDQSLTDVVTSPLERLQAQLQQSSELVSSGPNHDMVSFGLPWHAPAIQQPSFMEISDSINTAFLSPRE